MPYSQLGTWHQSPKERSTSGVEISTEVLNIIVRTNELLEEEEKGAAESRDSHGQLPYFGSRTMKRTS